MDRLGIVGGIGPESTIAYYRLVVAAVRERWPDRPQAPVLINSIDVQKVLRLAGAHALGELADYLVSEIDVLARGGAALAMIAANTPHIVFEQVLTRSPIPLLSIVDAACGAASARGLTRLGLFGTRFTMQGRFYADVFSKAGIDVVPPADDELALIHEIYVNELLNNVFLPGSRASLLRIAAAMKARDHVQGIILAGTELPLLLDDETAFEMPMLDTTRLHVHAAIERLWA